MDFDAQAVEFDRRTGLGQELGLAVAQALREITSAAAPATVLEIGAGTGEIGHHLAHWADGYIALDTSRAMLAQFMARQPGPRALLVQADANQAWPIATGRIDLIFASRALHLIDQQQLLGQLLRVAKPSGLYLIHGRVQRNDGGVRRAMRHLMHQQLESLGLQPRRASAHWQALKTLCCNSGARDIESARVGRWQSHYRPNDMLATWSAKPGLAGHSLDQVQQMRIMTALRREAACQIGDLDRMIAVEQCYQLQGLFFPSQALMQ